MKRYGLLGRSLQHSFSPGLHELLGDYSYELFEREEAEIPELFRRKDIGGLNVTIPYKKTVMRFLDEISDEARRIGCVNTILFNEGRISGYNTDYDGLALTLDSLRVDLDGAAVVILGKGATSRTAETVCRDRGAKAIYRLGREDHPIRDPEILAADLLINCTPVGMYPNNGETLVELDAFKGLKGVLDVVYNPRRTKLLLDARERNIQNRDGLLMLIGQAKRAAELFTGDIISEQTTAGILKILRARHENIVLIGMPGSGKSALGRYLSELTGKPFKDSDYEIELEIGMSIPDYFDKYGEEAFRKVEKAVIQRLGKETGQIIATGGGAVKDPGNYGPLKQNGRIYFIERELRKLSTEGRPLSKGGIETLEKLYEERVPLYRNFSDAVLMNEEITSCAADLLEDFNEHNHH